MKKTIKKGLILAMAGIMAIMPVTVNAWSWDNEDDNLYSGASQLVAPKDIKYKKPKAVSSLTNPTELKVYRSTEAALISWQKVENADYYIIYRKQGKSKWLYLGKTYEKDFYASTYYDNVREFVDIRYKNSKKKSSVNYKKKAYNYKKKYTYKIVAVNRNVKSTGATCTSKKWKMKKAELSYYTLYLVNKERKKKGKEFYTWGHSYEKGSLTRAKDLVTQTKKSRNKWHSRPNGYGWSHAFLYMENLTMKDPITGKKGYACPVTEDVGYTSGGTEDVFEAYCNSKGHYGPLMFNADEPGADIDVEVFYNGVNVVIPKNYVVRSGLSLSSATYSSNILKSTVYHELVIGDEDHIIKENQKWKWGE